MLILIGVLFAFAMLLMLIDCCMPGQLYFSLRPWWLSIILICALLIVYMNWGQIRQLGGF